jgi:outer membrane protein assembly factor BamD
LKTTLGRYFTWSAWLAVGVVTACKPAMPPEGATPRARFDWSVDRFERENTSRPNSPLADDAQFGVCRSFWAVSPDLPRDQEFTEKTIEECTRLLEFFPRSSLVGDARDLVAQARQKMAAKELRVGKYYYDRTFYESAIIYFENILQTYPEADVVPETLLVLHYSYTRVGFQMEADLVQQRLLELYPDSEQAQELTEAAGDEG